MTPDCEWGNPAFFESILDAREAARPGDGVVLIGPDGRNHAVWRKTKRGPLKPLWFSQEAAAVAERNRWKRAAVWLAGVSFFQRERSRFFQPSTHSAAG